MVNNSSCLQIDNSNGSTQDVSCDPPSTNSRIRRATDEELSAEVERMQKIARLATGISIQLDLIPGTLNPNELISELLHLGSITPAQIIAMNDTDIRSAIAELRTLPGILSNDSKIAEIETNLESLTEIWMLVKKGGDGTKWVGKDAFLEEMESVRDNKIGLEPVLYADFSIRIWEHEYGKLIDSNLDISMAEGYVKDLKRFAKNIISSIPQLTALSKDGIKLPNMFRAEEGLDPLSFLLAAVNTTQTKWNQIKRAELKNIVVFDSTVENVKMISELAKMLQEVFIHSVNDVIRSRTYPLVLASDKFSGFAKGFSDVNTLFDNLDDPWIKQFVKSDAISDSLNSLKQLAPLFRIADFSLRSPRDVRFIKEIDDILMIPTDLSTIDNAFQNVFSCTYRLKSVSQPDTSKVIAFIKLVRVLDEKIEKANDALKSLVGILDTTETKKLLSDVINLCATSDNSTVMQGIVDKLRNSYEVYNLHQKLEPTESLLEQIYEDPKHEAIEIIKNSTVVDDFIGELSTFNPFFKFLLSVREDDVKLVKNGIAVSKHLRSDTRKPVVVDNLETAIKTVIKSGASLKNLIDAIEGVKNRSTPESDALKDLADHQTHSMTIGLATHLVSTMAIALELKNDAQTVIQNVQSVKRLMNAMENPQHVQNLRKVVRVGLNLDIVYRLLDVWRDGVNTTSSTVLASHSDIFSSAAVGAGITEDFGNLAKSLGVLAAQVSDPNEKVRLDAVRDALESLATINLKFVSYGSATDAHDSLAALDLFFANYNPIILGAQNSSGGLVGPCKLVLVVTSADESNGRISFILAILFGCILGFGVLAGAAGLIAWLVVRKKKEPELEEVTARDENSVPLDVLPPRSTGTTSGTV